MRTLLRFSIALGSALAGGCFVVEDGPLDDVRAELEPDAGGFAHLSDTCDAVRDDIRSVPLRNNELVTVSLAGLNNDLNPTLCGLMAPGADGFLKIDGQSGQFWHFHISRTSGTADPVVSIYPISAQGTCNLASCQYIQDLCSDGEEHFGLRLSQPGTWALAIDSRNTETGNFTISAFSPVCGGGPNGVAEQEHGENCDDGNGVDDDTCDNSCRVVYKADFQEVNINNDQFWADRVIPTVDSAAGIVISGAVDPCDADLFAVQVPAGRYLRVDTLQAGGQTPESYTTANTNYRASIENASFSTSTILAAQSGTGNGLMSVNGGASGGLYFVRMRHQVGVTDLKTYTIRVSLVPAIN